MLKTFEVILDLEKTLYSGSSDLSFEVSSGDLDSVELTFLITQQDEILDLTGLDSLRLAIKKPSGLVVYQDLEITNPTGGEARAILTNQSYIEYGIHTAEVYLDDLDDVAVTCPFYFLSRSAILGDDSIESQNDWSAIMQLLFAYDKKPLLIHGVPEEIPEYIGQMAFDLDGKRSFIANDLTSIGWQVIGSGEGGGGGVVSWADILGKPAVFPPASHTHLWADITDKPTSFSPSSHTHLWADITDKPTLFAPQAHIHSIADITGLAEELDGKVIPDDLIPFIREDEADLKYAFKGDVGTGSITWADILNKPDLFPPSAHTHLWTEITNKPTVFPTDWGSVAGKPTTFTPTAHTHLWADITDKPQTFTPAAHVHTIADVTGLQGELDSKLETVPPEFLTSDEGDLRYAFKGDTGTGGGTIPVEDNLTSTSTTAALSANQGRVLNQAKSDIGHTHLWADITDKPTTFAPSAHTHLWAEITDKPTTFAPTAHTHTIGDVTGLIDALDNKADLVHTHLWADITDKPTTFAPSAHTHLWADITDKPTTFAPSAHTHLWADITDKPTVYPTDPTDWADILNKPDLFPPSAHTHLWAEITDKPTVFPSDPDDWTDILNKPDLFPPSAHTHLWAEITDKPTVFPSDPTDWADITGKPATFAPSAHTHLWAEITDKPTTFAPSAHTHLWADITDKPLTFAPSSHTHLWADITDKPLEYKPVIMTGAQRGGAQVGNGLAMSGEYLFVKTISADGTRINTTNNNIAIDRTVVDTWYALKAHTHLWADITDKPATFAPSAHTHLWADLTDKPTTFAPSAHTHPWTDVTGKPTTFAPAAHTHTEVDLTFGGINAKTYVDNGDNAIINSYLTGHKIWSGTSAAYTAIGTKDPNTLYFVSG